MTPEEIAYKYVHGDHDALTDSQEKKDVAKDIREYGREMCKEQRIICAKKLPTMQVTGELYDMIYRNIRDCENPIDGYIEQSENPK